MYATKYPIFFVHGAGMRDSKYRNYWGRIPKTLQQQGVVVGYGNQDSWGTIEHNALTLKDNLKNYIEQTGCEKVNIIAHSKGGLDVRYLISQLQGDTMVASVTTICTPHHGSKTMDALMKKIPTFAWISFSFCMNRFATLFGDKCPDFYQTCKQLTTNYAQQFNQTNPDSCSVYYQSYAALMKNPKSDLLLSIPYLLVQHWEGENDGLVSISSAKWGEFCGVLTTPHNRGVSHEDMIDIRRSNLALSTPSQDICNICEYYLSIIKQLKALNL